MGRPTSDCLCCQDCVCPECDCAGAAKNLREWDPSEIGILLLIKVPCNEVINSSRHTQNPYQQRKLPQLAPPLTNHCPVPAHAHCGIIENALGAPLP